MKNDFFSFTGNLALNSIEGAINYHHPLAGSKTLVFVPKTQESISLWGSFMHGLKDNDTWHAHHQGDWGVVDKVQGQSFRVFQTKSHYVIGAALDDPDLQWSGIVAAYAQQNHPVIDFHDKNNMTPFDFQTILDNTSYLIKAEKEQQKGK